MSDYEDDFDPAVDDIEPEEDESPAVSDDEVDGVVNDEDEDEAGSGDEDEEVPAVPLQSRQVIREIIVVPDGKRMTSNILSSLEMTEIVSIRATQISQFNNCRVPNSYDDPIKQAQLELMKKECPLLVERDIGERLVDGELVKHVEHWNPNTMNFAVHYDV